jgi:hypothetical protein
MSSVKVVVARYSLQNTPERSITKNYRLSLSNSLLHLFIFENDAFLYTEIWRKEMPHFVLWITTTF